VSTIARSPANAPVPGPAPAASGATPTILSLLIPAVGGQGGGVLSEWLVDAALIDGFPVHGTSIPGVAQRTGSTTYYVELYSERGAEEPVFSLYPVPGALDVLLAPEFLEVGRMIELGFVSPSRTTVIASTHRLLSIHEKIATGRAIYPQEGLQRAAETAARRLVAFDALTQAREHGTEANAVLLGAMAGAGVLPISDEAYRKAIERKNVAVASNLAGFELGKRLVLSVAAAGGDSGEAPSLATALARGASPESLPADMRTGIEAMPARVRDIVVRGVHRLVDYQDLAYAREYLAELRAFVPSAAASETQVETLAVVARYLALWMSYEDAVRVADLKTRSSRFARIRESARAGNATVVVTDYLKPDLDEIWGVLPDRLVRPFARWAERRWPHGRPTLGQHVRTTTISGFLRVWLLARLKPLRRISYRAREERTRITRWLTAVRTAMAQDAALGVEVARAGQLVKGYGDVRRRMMAVHEHILAAALRAAAQEAGRGAGAPVATALATRLRQLVLAGPDSEVLVAEVATTVLARLESGDAAGALETARAR
jgi:indolepyruvate ferredoxin oxidoreductase, beta subunit